MSSSPLHLYRTGVYSFEYVKNILKPSVCLNNPSDNNFFFLLLLFPQNEELSHCSSLRLLFVQVLYMHFCHRGILHFNDYHVN